MHNVDFQTRSADNFLCKLVQTNAFGMEKEKLRKTIFSKNLSINEVTAKTNISLILGSTFLSFVED